MDVKEIAAGVAHDIREHGHYQGEGPLWDYLIGSSGKCCVLFNPTLSKSFDAEELLREALDSHGVTEHPVYWNDQTPTETVLETLDKIAAGE